MHIVLDEEDYILEEENSSISNDSLIEKKFFKSLPNDVFEFTFNYCISNKNFKYNKFLSVGILKVPCKIPYKIPEFLPFKDEIMRLNNVKNDSNFFLVVKNKSNEEFIVKNNEDLCKLFEIAFYRNEMIDLRIETCLYNNSMIKSVCTKYDEVFKEKNYLIDSRIISSSCETFSEQNFNINPAEKQKTNKINLENLNESFKNLNIISTQLKDLQNRIDNISDKLNKKENTIMKHPDINCDSCNNSICGIRYKCVTCNDYDLCEDCEKLNDIHYKNHIFFKIKSPIKLHEFSDWYYFKKLKEKFINYYLEKNTNEINLNDNQDFKIFVEDYYFPKLNDYIDKMKRKLIKKKRKMHEKLYDNFDDGNEKSFKHHYLSKKGKKLSSNQTFPFYTIFTDRNDLNKSIDSNYLSIQASQSNNNYFNSSKNLFENKQNKALKMDTSNTKVIKSTNNNLESNEINEKKIIYNNLEKKLSTINNGDIYNIKNQRSGEIIDKFCSAIESLKTVNQDKDNLPNKYEIQKSSCIPPLKELIGSQNNSINLNIDQNKVFEKKSFEEVSLISSADLSPECSSESYELIDENSFIEELNEEKSAIIKKNSFDGLISNFNELEISNSQTFNTEKDDSSDISNNDAKLKSYPNEQELRDFYDKCKQIFTLY